MSPLLPYVFLGELHILSLRFHRRFSGYFLQRMFNSLKLFNMVLSLVMCAPSSSNRQPPLGLNLLLVLYRDASSVVPSAVISAAAMRWWPSSSSPPPSYCYGYSHP